MSPLLEHPRLLVVDDDASGLEVLQAVLADEGYELVTARNGREALERARESVPDLVLLDAMMPVLDGFETLRRLRSDPVLAEVPVIMVTALHDRDSRLLGIEAGADDFITKPIDSVELRARVRTVTRLDRFRRLQSERAKFEWAVETSDDGFLSVGERDQVLYANPSARALLGLPQGGVPAEPFLALAGRSYRCEPEAAWASWPAPVSAPGSRFLVRPESSTATALWLEVDAFLLPAPGDPQRLVRLHDVTERLRTRRETWALHSAVSHKLLTPLAAMLPSLEYLSTDEEPSAETVRELAGAAFRGAERLDQAIQEILQYVEAARAPWSDMPFELSGLPALVEEVRQRLGLGPVTLLGQEGVGGLRLRCSKRALDLVLAELFGNARKFHPRQLPALEIEVSRPAREDVTLAVRDDGDAIPPDRLIRVASPYYQSEKHHTGQLAGMGLGLAMVAAIAWSVGGSCRVENRTNRPGVVVVLRLPLVA
jgi:CheY-like chemotaxis protein/anti-sigma regulatory factor (Ser/Thr protein kinase)